MSNEKSARMYSAMRLGLSDEMASASELLCGEDADSLESSPYDVAESEFRDDSGEYIAGFIGSESDYSPGFDYMERFRSHSLDPFARAESIAWILKVQTYYHFCPLTAYLAVNYMDRFLSSHSLPDLCMPPIETTGKWMGIATLSCDLPLLSCKDGRKFSAIPLRFAEDAKYVFEPRTILRMELLILASLNWRLRSVTPFTFIDFFAYKIDPCGKYVRYLILRATQIILATIHDIEILDHCPSSMAAAAIICATDEIPALAFISPTIASTWCIGLKEEGIRSCYQLMQQVAICSIQRKHPVILSQMRVTTTPNLTTSSPSKRRKLSNDGG